MSPDGRTKTNTSSSQKRGLRLRLWHVGLRGLLLGFRALMALAKLVGRRKRALPERPLEILITGTFHSHNWIEAHLRPLAASDRVARVRMVASTALPEIGKVEGIYPPSWLLGTLGEVPARLLQFMWTAITSHADVIGGFHLLFNAMVAALLANLKGATSLYICGGGIQELADGGILSENRLFKKLGYGDKGIERSLVQIACECDLTVTMGASAIDGLRAMGVRSRFVTISGGRDARVFHRSTGTDKTHDIVFVGRLAEIKRLDLLLRAIARMRQAKPDVRAVLVGDGPLRASLEALAGELQVQDNVTFAGAQNQTHPWLIRARVFVLTSETEGLSLALMEAMMCGLPAVVPEIGDLPELVQDGVSGFLVRDRLPESFASPILRLITDAALYERMSSNAQRSSIRFDVPQAAALWDRAFSSSHDEPSAAESYSVGAQANGGN